MLWLVAALAVAVAAPSPRPASADRRGTGARPGPAEFAGLSKRIAADLRAGRPLVVTVHVALCDNETIWCGSRRLGNGDDPPTNLYWGGAAGLRAWFDHRPGWSRVHRDAGDGREVLERVVYRRRVRAPAPAWRARGVTRPFEVVLVGIAYRGRAIGRATSRLLEQVSGEASEPIVLPGGARVAFGGASHVIGYAGHNHLMDAPRLDQPAFTRRTPVGWFVLACRSNPYFAPRLGRAPAHALLVTKVLMYPGAFTVEGLVQGLVEGRDAQGVARAGADRYALHQKHTKAAARSFFTHGGRPDFRGVRVPSFTVP